jgi:hypothetical protein
MHIKVREQLVELLEEDDAPAKNNSGLIIALGILILAFGVSAAVFAVIL